MLLRSPSPAGNTSILLGNICLHQLEKILLILPHLEVSQHRIRAFAEMQIIGIPKCQVLQTECMNGTRSEKLKFAQQESVQVVNYIEKKTTVTKLVSTSKIHIPLFCKTVMLILKKPKYS